MEVKRSPFQGVINIIRFNWHFYLIACLVFVVLFIGYGYLPAPIQPFLLALTLLAAWTVAASLLASYYVYDLSDLYKLKWMAGVDPQHILSINAGFDETSVVITSKFPNSILTVCDFYNPESHTEVSIKRARKAYPPPAESIQVTTDRLPFADHSFDVVLAILSAHEIRDEEERIRFFKELGRVTKPANHIFVTEHLRDANNFAAYTFGFFHFHSRSAWLRTFERAQLTVTRELKTTPFITTFVLENHGNSL